MTIAFVDEEINRHIKSIKEAWGAFKKFKDLYNSHLELEFIQLQLKLFNLDVKGNDPMALASKIKDIMHNIVVVDVKVDIALTAFIKALYPTCSNYLEANGNLKSLKFDLFVEKIAEHEKTFEKIVEITRETLCIAQKGNDQDASREENSIRGKERKNYKGKGGTFNQDETTNRKETIYYQVLQYSMGEARKQGAS